MSSRQYTVSIKLKDDNGVLKQLEQLGGAGHGRGSSGLSNAAPSNSLFKKLEALSEKKNENGPSGSILHSLESLGASQLLKLTGIGVGVGSMVNLLTKSSGQLQSLFKLWETGMMLVFRPMADAIALSLRPVSNALYAMFIVPFYKTVYPWFLKYTQGGKAYEPDLNKAPPERLDVQFFEFEKRLAGKYQSLGGELSEFADNLSTQLAGVPSSIGKKFLELETNISNNLTNIPTFMVDIFLRVGGNISDNLIGIPNSISQVFLNLGANMSKYLVNIPTFFSDIFLRLGGNIWNGLLSVPDTIAGVFTGLASNIITALANIPNTIYNAIVGWINTLTPLGALGAGGGSGPDLSSRFAGNTRTRTTMAGMADAVSV